MPEDLIGKVIGGCQLLSEVGQGGMGVIYKARQLSLDRDIAIKILSSRLADDPAFVERFQREARAIAKRNHQNILAIYDVGVDQGLHYMIMELIEGQSLAEFIKKRGVLPPKDAADYIRQAALGLACAQQSGIIHRDVKPENLMLTKQGIIKVSDFGLAKDLGSGTLTATDSLMGTPAYMSPEQCDGKALDVRSDIYSLGGSFYRLVTGRLPFEAETAMSMLYRHKYEPVVPPRQIVPAIPEALSRVIVKMMAKRREGRYQTMEEVAQAIEEALKAPEAPDVQRTIELGAGPLAAGMSPERVKLERLIAQGDARLKRKDLPGAARMWREAQAIEDDPRLRERLEQHALPEIEKRKDTAEQMVVSGQLSEAARSYRSALDLDPDDGEVASRLKEIEERLAKRREAINQVRQLLAAARYEEAVEAWDALPEDVRDEALGKQVQRARDVTLPVLRLCEQAESALDAGDLERALSLYNAAAGVDPQSERAQAGVREAQSKLNRVERTLKEGFGYNVREDYERAIQAWENVLKVCPNHSQAKKLIIEARMRIGHGLREKRRRQEAIAQWRQILKIEPEHRVAGALLQEDLANQEALGSLADEAKTAFSRRKYGRAIARWRQMLQIDPGNRSLDTSVVEARRLRRHKILKTLVVLAIVLPALFFGGAAASEWRTLSRAQSLGLGGKLEEAQETLAAYDLPAFFLGGTMKRARRSLTFQALFARVRKCLSGGEFEKADSLLRQVGQFAETDAEKTDLARQRALLAVLRLISEGDEVLAMGDRLKAGSLYRRAEAAAREAGLGPEERKAREKLEGIEKSSE